MLCLLQLYYLDHLHDSAAPLNKRGTPRIKYFDRNIIQALTRADKGKIRKGEEAFGHCSVFFLMCQSFFLVLLHISHIFFSSEAPQRPATQMYHPFMHNSRHDSIYIFVCHRIST